MKGGAAACFALACLLAGGCSSNARKGVGGATPARGAGAAATNDAPAGGGAGKLDFTLTNYTGATLRAVYLSPSDSGGWEENVLGGGEFNDGESVEIRFSPAERAEAWDLRVEGVGGHLAEWKGLRLGDVSKITMLLDVVGERVVVAEVE